MPPEIIDPKAVIPPEKKVETPPAGEPPKVIDEDKLDDLGYEKVEEDPKDEKKPEVKLDKKVLDEKEKIEKPSTGYGDEPPKIEEEVKPPEEKKDVELGYELKVDAILPKEEVTKLKDFAKANNLTKEVAQAYFDMRKNDYQQAKASYEEQQKAFEKEKVRTRSEWHKELKDDPTFGGDKFQFNVQRAEKVLQDFLPGTKKMLTERGSMLPPYVMRDLAKLADHLYSTEKLTQGEAPVPPEEVKQEDDALAFYQ